ncbi:MAG: hypothetical protein V3U93_03495 [Alphaproteobacteria bacterium]
MTVTQDDIDRLARALRKERAEHKQTRLTLARVRAHVRADLAVRRHQTGPEGHNREGRT